MPERRNGPEDQILGIVRSKDDPLEWKPFTDEKTALHAGLDDIVFGKTLSECAATLQGKFPAADPRLTRLAKHSHGTYSGCRWCDNPVINVLAEDQQYYDGSDRFEALALAKKFGSIRCSLERHNYGKSDPVNWTEEGCVVSPPASGAYHAAITGIRYNPKGVLRAVKAAKTRAKHAPIKCSDVSQACWELRDLVREHISSLSYDAPDGQYSRYNVAWLFLETIKYFSFVFGPHSYRKHPAFRELKLLWKVHPERTRKAFLSSYSLHHDVIPKFCNFMDHEIRVRNGKLTTKKADWKPRHEFPDFHEFASCAYEEVLRAREKAAKAKAKAKANASGKGKAKRARPKSRRS